MSRGYQKSSMAPKLLIVAALIGGVGFAFKNEIMKLVNAQLAKKVVEVVPAKPKIPTKIPVIIEKPAPVVVSKPVPVKVKVAPPVRKPSVMVSEKRKREARGVHMDGVAAVKELDFAKAADLFKQEAAMVKRDAALHDKAMAYAKRAGIFNNLLKDIPVNPEAENEMVTIRCYDGKLIKEVAIARETSTQYIVRKRSGISMPIAKSMVEAVERISDNERKLRLQNKFMDLVRTKNAKTAGDYFELAKVAYQDQLKPEALKYLNEAWKKGGENLFKIVRVDGATKYLKNAYWCESTGRTLVAKVWCRKVIKDYKDLPDKVKAARELIALMDKPKPKAYVPTVVFKEKSTRKVNTTTTASTATTKEPEDVSVVVNKISTSKGANTALVNEINTKFDEAMDHFMKGRPGQPNSNRHLGAAAKLFDEVSELCEKALKVEPDNVAIQNRQTDATRHAYHSRKMQTL